MLLETVWMQYDVLSDVYPKQSFKLAQNLDFKNQIFAFLCSYNLDITLIQKRFFGYGYLQIIVSVYKPWRYVHDNLLTQHENFKRKKSAPWMTELKMIKLLFTRQF